jgi:tripartite-type tricarboxylate transporter receptor subunit TctC
LAPAKTPDAIITVLQDAVIAGLRPGSPAIDKIAALGAEIATPEQMTAKGFAAFIRADYEAMGAAAKLAGITPT